MKPFLLLSHRPEDAEAHREHADVARFSGLALADVRQCRLDKQELGTVDLARYSGILVAGGPYNVTEPIKNDEQLRVEAELLGVTQQCLADDFPYFGLCYGMGILAQATGGVVDREYFEPPGTPMIFLTDAGRQDPLLDGTPESFEAFTGHKEAVSTLAPDVVLLATGEAAPHQLVRAGTNVYAAQFHPELDATSLVSRLTAYRLMGYFPADEFESTIAWARSTDVGPASNDLLAAFVRRYARD